MVTQPPGGSAMSKAPWPFFPDPTIRPDKLSPERLAAMEALDRLAMAETEEIVKQIRAKYLRT